MPRNALQSRITVRMSPQLRRNLEETYIVWPPIREYLTHVGRLLRQETARNSPVDTGAMRISHRAYIDRDNPPTWVRVQAEARSRQGADYPWFVHQGTRPHFPPVEAITPWAERHGIDPWALAIHISRHGTRANPWFETAVRRLLPTISNLGRLAGNIQRRWYRG